MIALSGTQLAYRWLTTTPARLVPDEREAARAFRRECLSWMRAAQIEAFALGDKEETSLSNMREPVLRFYVRRKLASRRVKTLIPAVISLPGSHRRVMTDVSVAKVARASCGPASRIYGRYVGPNDAGTASCVLYAIDNPSTRYILSAWHVLCGPGGRAADPISCDNSICGMLSGKYQSLTPEPAKNPFRIQSFDGALALANPGSTETGSPHSNLHLSGIRLTPVAKGETLTCFGSFSGAARAAVVLEPAVTEPIGYRYGYITFANLIKTTLLSQKGDSGAPVVDATNKLVGYVVADDSDSAAAATWIQPIQQVLSEYAVSLAVEAQATTNGEGTQPKDQIDILARTLWGEARGEPEKGIIAIAWVVLNRLRMRPLQFGTSIAGVCQKPKQFSCWNKDDRNLPKLLGVNTANSAFRRCLEVARAAVANSLPEDPTFGSCHYHTVGTIAKWSVGHTPAVRIGDHVFFNDVA